MVEETYDDNQGDDVTSESPEYSPKSEFSKAEVVEQAVIKCLESRGQEMKAGYFNTFVDKNGMVERQWVPDSREKFMSCVDALRSLLAPEIERDKEYRDDEKEVVEDIENLNEIYMYEEKKLIVKDNKLVYELTGRKIIPAIGSTVVIEKLDQRTKRVTGEPTKGGWDEKINSYKDELVMYYDEIFALLNKLIDRLNYFKPQSVF